MGDFTWGLQGLPRVCNAFIPDLRTGTRLQHENGTFDHRADSKLCPLLIYVYVYAYIYIEKVSRIIMENQMGCSCASHYFPMMENEKKKAVDNV